MSKQATSTEGNVLQRSTPRTDALQTDFLDAWARKVYAERPAAELSATHTDLAMKLARELERDLEICRDAHMANCLAADTLRTEIRALREELAQSKAPVIGECEDCGHKIVTPLKRIA